MLRNKIQNRSNEHGEVEASRRSFFGRLAVGAVLSLAMPGIVHASKSTAVKADKNHRAAHSARSAVRLPKQSATQTAKEAHQARKFSKTAHVEHGRQHTAHADHYSQHNSRVHDVYTGKERTINAASIQTSRNPNYGRLSTYRALAFQNPHTGDKLSVTYFEKGRYLNDALDEISFLLRDYRTGDVHPIDPELLDQLHDLKQMLGLSQPFDVICGYRSPLTNAQLHAEHAGVASNSFHIHGRAVDIRIERFSLHRIHNAALAMHRGGVGYYPQSNFIHLDTGTFRTWTL